jgi:2'-5' RNA ligase
MRTFVAIELEPEIKKNLSQFIQKLENHNPHIKWIKNQGMHLTLKFIGEIPDDKASDIQSTLRDISFEHERFPLKLVGTGTFPARSRYPRVLWVGIEDSQKLISIQNDVETKLEKLSIPREKRKFHPHLTLGRVKSSQNIAPVLEELANNINTQFGSMDVETITFFKSTLKPTGAEYNSLSKIQLK